MEITGKTALVTGANRGLGRHLARELRDRGAPSTRPPATRGRSTSTGLPRSRST